MTQDTRTAALEALRAGPVNRESLEALALYLDSRNANGAVDPLPGLVRQAADLLPLPGGRAEALRLLSVVAERLDGMNSSGTDPMAAALRLGVAKLPEATLPVREKREKDHDEPRAATVLVLCGRNAARRVKGRCDLFIVRLEHGGLTLGEYLLGPVPYGRLELLATGAAESKDPRRKAKPLDYRRAQAYRQAIAILAKRCNVDLLDPHTGDLLPGIAVRRAPMSTVDSR